MKFLGRTRNDCFCCGLIAHVFLLWTTIVSAQTPPAPSSRDEYEGLIQEAVEEYRAGNYPEAHTLFSQAHRLRPNARTLRGLGMTSYELRRYAESIDHLRQALEATDRALDANLRAQTEGLLRRAARFVLQLELRVEPPSATVRVDGREPRVAPKMLVLESGDHVLLFEAPGFASETRNVTVSGGEREVWEIALTPKPPEAPPLPEVTAVPTPAASAAAAGPRADIAAPRAPTRSDREPLYKNPWLWTGVGVGVVAVLTTVLLVTRPETKTVSGEAVRTDFTPADGVLTASWRTRR